MNAIGLSLSVFESLAVAASAPISG